MTKADPEGPAPQPLTPLKTTTTANSLANELHGHGNNIRRSGLVFKLRSKGLPLAAGGKQSSIYKKFSSL